MKRSILKISFFSLVIFLCTSVAYAQTIEGTVSTGSITYALSWANPLKIGSTQVNVYVSSDTPAQRANRVFTWRVSTGNISWNVGNNGRVLNLNGPVCSLGGVFVVSTVVNGNTIQRTVGFHVVCP